MNEYRSPRLMLRADGVTSKKPSRLVGVGPRFFLVVIFFLMLVGGAGVYLYFDKVELTKKGIKVYLLGGEKVLGEEVTEENSGEQMIIFEAERTN